jgi:hypothetical protein
MTGVKLRRGTCYIGFCTLRRTKMDFLKKKKKSACEKNQHWNGVGSPVASAGRNRSHPSPKVVHKRLVSLERRQEDLSLRGGPTMRTIKKHGQRCPSHWRHLRSPGLRLVPRACVGELSDLRCHPAAAAEESLHLSELWTG